MVEAELGDRCQHLRVCPFTDTIQLTLWLLLRPLACQDQSDGEPVKTFNWHASAYELYEALLLSNNRLETVLTAKIEWSSAYFSNIAIIYSQHKVCQKTLLSLFTDLKYMAIWSTHTLIDTCLRRAS